MLVHIVNKYDSSVRKVLLKDIQLKEL
jgi:hypothetical protein